MKILVFSDIHIHNFKQYNKGNERLEHTLRCLKLIFAYANKQGIDTILFCGDLFDQQKSLPTIVINRMTEVMIELDENYPTITVYSITGNHDQDAMNLISAEANSSQTWLNKLFPWWVLVDNYSSVVQQTFKVAGIPYYELGEDYKTKLQEAKTHDTLPSILIIHQTPQNVKNAEYYKVDTDDADNLYADWDLVLCGHIHANQRLAKNFLVVGAPMQQNFGDAGTEKGFWVIDTEDLQGEHKFVCLNSKFPTFVKRIEGEEPNPEDKDSDYVQVVPEIIAQHVGQEGIESFRADLPEEELIKNYLDEVADDDPSLTKYGVTKDEELLTIGIDLIN